MEFEDWLCYIDAMRHSPGPQAICLLELISAKLDLGVSADFYRAEKAIQDVLRDEEGRG